jgi:hypothetical protein
MQIIDVPIYNEDGSVQFTQKVSPAEAQQLLMFALNFLVATGVAVSGASPDNETPPELND